jgi:phage-related baseplate assembly protein
VNPELNYVILENVDAIGNTSSGNILIIVNDGSGTVGDLLFNSLSIAIAAVRPIGTHFSIQPPQITKVQVGLSLECPPQVSLSTVQSLLQAAIAGYINSRAIGVGLSVTRISQLAYRTEPQIVNVSDVTLNGQTADLVALPTGSYQFLGLSFT